MSKAILLSIQPQHVVNILNGRKTLELRKTLPKDFEGWVYIYVTKAKPFLTDIGEGHYRTFNVPHFGDVDLNGKVVAKFWFDEYGEIGEYDQLTYTVRIDNVIITKYGYPKELKDKTCLNDIEIDEYLYTSKNGFLYAWHIKQLTIFDKPLEMCQFKVKVDNYSELNDPSPFYVRVERAPQSYMYVKELI